MKFYYQIKGGDSNIDQFYNQTKEIQKNINLKGQIQQFEVLKNLITKNPQYAQQLQESMKYTYQRSLISNAVLENLNTYIQELKNNKEKEQNGEESLQLLNIFVEGYLFEPYDIKGIQQLLQEQYFEENLSEIQRNYEQLDQLDDNQIKQLSHKIEIYLEVLIKKKYPENYKQQDEELEQSVQRVMNYYKNEKKYSDKDVQRYADQLKKQINIEILNNYMNKYLKEEDPKDIIEDFLNELQHGNQGKNNLFGQYDENEFRDMIKDLNYIQEDMNKDELNDFFQKIKEQKKNEENQKHIRKQETQNQRNDSVIGCILIGCLLIIVSFCIYRYKRQKKLEYEIFQQTQQVSQIEQ